MSLLRALLVALLLVPTAAPAADPAARLGAPQKDHGCQIVSVALAPNGATAAAVTADCRLFVWDVASGKQLAQRTTLLSYSLAPMIFAPHGETLTHVGDGQSIRFWDVPTRAEVNSWKGPDGGYIAVGFAPDGRTVAVAGPDQVIRLVDATTGTERAALGTAVKPQGVAALSVSALALSADGRILAAGRRTDRRTSLQVWDVFANTMIHDLDNKGAWIIAIVLSPDGRLVGYRDQGGHMNMVEVASGRRLWRLENQGRVGGLTEAFSLDSRFLVSAGPAGPVLIEALSGREVHCIRGQSVTAAALSAHGNLLAVGQNDGTVLIWNLRDLLAKNRPDPKKVTAADLDRCWLQLLSDDAGQAQAAVQTLAAVPELSVKFLEARLEPARLDEAKLARWLGELDANSFEVRQRAMQQIENLGEMVESRLRTLLTERPPLEVTRRVEKLLANLENRTYPPTRVRVLRAIQVLEETATPEARRILARLAEGSAGLRETEEAKASLARLEKRAAAP